MKRPAELLTGLELVDGWKVAAPVGRTSGASGGNFSNCYLVERTTQQGYTEKAFCKALDLTFAMKLKMPVVDAMNAALEAYRHERDVVMQCAGRRLGNVVIGFASGEVRVPADQLDPQYLLFESVPFIVFEAAQADVRTVLLDNMVSFDDAWAFRMLHGAANGMRQLHGEDIAHQDVKPSNLMAFDGTGKLGDLGRSSPSGGGGPWDAAAIAGDTTYAPPELLYRELLSDDRARRRAADLYQLGSLVAFFFADSALTALWSAELDPAFHWSTWPRDYRNALPYVRQAFDQALTKLEPRLPDYCRAELLAMLREMCEPDPNIRGNPRGGSGAARYNLQRYVSKFDRFATVAEMKVQTRMMSPP